MALLVGHLDQITTSARAIADLDFPQPRIFTKAVLGHHEITTLIRDTEPHERSLFTIDPDASSASALSQKSSTIFTDGSNRRKTVNQVQQRQGSAVAKVLGNDMLHKIQQSSRGQGRSRGVDIEVLLQGAERLCVVYPVAGLNDRISKLRSRHGQIAQSVAHYEALVLKQQAKLNRSNKGTKFEQEDDTVTQEVEPVLKMTEEDLKAEEAEVRELEARKGALEARVAGMEKDLGGLLR